MINNKLCGERIKLLRKENKLSQDDLALKCNVIRQTLARWERGELNLTLDDTIHLCNVLDCDIGYLTGEYSCRKHVTADVRKALNLEESTIDNIVKLGVLSKEQVSENLEIIDYIALINKIFSSKQLQLIEHLSAYINYSVNNSIEWKIHKNNCIHELYDVKVQKPLFGEIKPAIIPDNFMEEIHLKNVIKDIEILKSILVEENNKKIADKKVKNLEMNKLF